MKKFDLTSLVRKNILALEPYSCARDEFKGDKGIFLDANENPYGTLNRYPDTQQKALKSELSKIKQIPSEQIFIGNGSDEVIDLIFRVFTTPQKDKIIICPPTYGMYEVSANINDVEIEKVPLLSKFQLDIENILRKINETEIKLIFICSPNNPTGNSLKSIDILLQNFNGIVVLDEAYIDFCADKSYLKNLNQYPNLIITQTFSKAWALAGARVGIAYASTEIIGLMNKVKPPYNVSTLNQKEALKALLDKETTQKRIEEIINERAFLIKEFDKLAIVKKIYPSDANFLLIEVSDANYVYNQLINKEIIIRNRNSQVKNCVRVTIGTPDENQSLLAEMKRLNTELKNN
ncbi:histidinol-phosphate transaminase [Weeksellaceae bacterium TAE3-ERU29]|nr:histidinol-phosphate transaminase [Weeksellaceae bacterium TAE3-ERU29]